MTVRGRSSARRVEFTPAWSSRPRTSPLAYGLGRLAWSSASRVERWIASSPVSVQVIRPPRPKGSSSSSTVRGGRGWRTWSVTVSFGSVYLESALVRYASGSSGTRSGSGTATTRPSDSSRSSSVEDVTTGTAVPTHAEQVADVVDRIAGYKGAHRTGYWRRLADRLGDAGVADGSYRPGDEEATP